MSLSNLLTDKKYMERIFLEHRLYYVFQSAEDNGGFQTFDDMAIVKIMKEIVPEYKSQVSKYQVLDN